MMRRQNSLGVVVGENVEAGPDELGVAVCKAEPVLMPAAEVVLHGSSRE